MKFTQNDDGTLELDETGCPAAHVTPWKEIDPADEIDGDAWVTCPCMLDRGHVGDHLDGYDRTFTDAEDVWQ